MARNIPTIVVLAFLVASVVAGVFLVQQQNYFRLSASTQSTPIDVRITNVTDTSFTVSFYTKKEGLASINWGKQGEDLDNFKTSDNKQLTTLHHIEINGLEEQTSYSFNINISGENYDNNGTNWKVTTARKTTSLKSDFFTGKIIDESGRPIQGAIVYLQIGGANMSSSQTSKEGVWIIPTSTIRTQGLDRNFDFSINVLVNIFVQAGKFGASTAQIYSENADSVPDISIGKSFDFTKLDADESGSLSEVELVLPEDNKESRFEISDSPLPKNN